MLDLDKIITEAEERIDLLPEKLVNLKGMSSGGVRRLLNLLCREETTRYFEVGVWTGSTLLSASYGNKGSYLGVDNWSKGDNYRDYLRNEVALRKAYPKNYKSCRVEVMNCNCWDEAVLAAISDVDVYFYDGDHGYVPSKQSLTHFLPKMKTEFIFVVDDWNWPAVRKGAQEGVEDSGCQILDKRELRCKPKDPLWWNGLCLYALRKSNV